MTLKVQEGTVLLGKYRVEKELGHGAMGYVMAARHVELDEPRALKLLLPDALKSADIAERFIREAKACARLKNEHALRVHDFGRLDDGSPVMVMEYLVGEDLQSVLDRRKRLPHAEAASYVLQVCEAVAEAHELKIVHRDLKPSNLFLTRRPDGTACVKVLDFGISKSLDDATEHAPKLTATNTVMGTPYYMSPEQLRNSKATDSRGDIWSLGVILYEFVTGRVPFDGDNFVDISSNVVFRDPTPPSQICADIPGELDRIILRCLEKDPNDRFPSVREFMAALRPFAAVSVSHDVVSVLEPGVSTSAQAGDDRTTTKQSDSKDTPLDETLPAPARPREAAASTPGAEIPLSEPTNSYAQRFLRNQTEKLEAQRIARRRKIAMRLAKIVVGVGALIGGVTFLDANATSIESWLASIRAKGGATASASSEAAPAPSETAAPNPTPSASVTAPVKAKIATKPAVTSGSRATPKSSASAASSAAAPPTSSKPTSSSASAAAPAKPAPSAAQ